MLGKWTMFHNVPPSSNVSQSRHHYGVVLRRNMVLLKLAREGTWACPRRTLRPPPGPHTSFPGKWHQGLTGPSHVPTGLWSVRGHILLPTRCALKRFWKWKEQERVCQGAEGQGAEHPGKKQSRVRTFPRATPTGPLISAVEQAREKSQFRYASE